MTCTRTISGLPFQAHSPSRYTLIHSEPARAEVELAFNGLGWWLYYRLPGRAEIKRPIRSLQAGATLLAGRQTEMQA